MEYGISLAKTGKPYILAQIRYAEYQTYYVQVKHQTQVTKPYGFSFYVKCGNQQFKQWVEWQNYSCKSLAEEGTTPYVRCYIRPRGKSGLINMQIPGTPLNRTWGASKRFNLHHSANVMVGKIYKTMRMGIAVKDHQLKVKKVFAIISFGGKSAVTCASCQAQENWGLGGWVTDSKWKRYVQTYLPCYTCGKVLSHPLKKLMYEPIPSLDHISLASDPKPFPIAEELALKYADKGTKVHKELEVLGEVAKLKELENWMKSSGVYLSTWAPKFPCNCHTCQSYIKKCKELDLDYYHAYEGVNL